MVKRRKRRKKRINVSKVVNTAYTVAKEAMIIAFFMLGIYFFINVGSLANMLSQLILQTLGL